jgi:hypothetical protein
MTTSVSEPPIWNPTLPPSARIAPEPTSHRRPPAGQEAFSVLSAND